jgi:hypothetical protein
MKNICFICLFKLLNHNVRIFVILTFLCVHCASAQELNGFNLQRSKIDQRLMVTLGSWSTINLVGSGIGWASAGEGEARYFHQMNVMWNAVNLGLALPGYFKAKKIEPSMSLSRTIQEQYQTEKIFMFNAALDLTYITAGFLLRNEAIHNTEKQNQFNGFGNSLILQGGFLFIFDLVAHAIHAQHRKKVLNPIIDRLSVSSTGIGLRLGLN